MQTIKVILSSPTLRTGNHPYYVCNVPLVLIKSAAVGAVGLTFLLD